MIGVRLDPVDTWFFRDSTPFAAGASPQEGVPSLFPPHPPTVAGALRAALARENGWNGVRSWQDAKIIDALGDGPDDLGKVSFDGPFLLRGGKPMFRAPRHLLGRLLGSTEGDKWNPTVFLRPGDPVECDLGEVRLPQTASRVDEPETLKPGDDIWLTEQGMTAALGARLPNAEDIENAAAFWESEYRIGLARDNDARTGGRGLAVQRSPLAAAKGRIAWRPRAGDAGRLARPVRPHDAPRRRRQTRRVRRMGRAARNRISDRRHPAKRPGGTGRADSAGYRPEHPRRRRAARRARRRPRSLGVFGPSSANRRLGLESASSTAAKIVTAARQRAVLRT